MRDIKRIIFIFILFPLCVMGQKSRVWNKPLYDSYPYHFGFAFSLGILDFSVIHSPEFNNFDTVLSVNGDAKPIFGAHIVGNLKLNDNFDLRLIPGLSFGQRDLEYKAVYNGQIRTYDRKIESTLLQFPLYIKYRAIRENNYRPYLLLGANYTLDLATRKKIDADEEVKVRLKKHDILLETGFGIDYYLPYFKFSTEIKFSYGLFNLVDYDDTEYTDIFSRLGTKMVTVSIFFE